MAAETSSTAPGPTPPASTGRSAPCADRGFAAIGPANPLRHLTGDAASLAAPLGTISGPMVLVGHSYGGAVISNAATGNQQVQALVFIAGWSRMFVALLLASTAALVGCAWAGEYERTMPSRYAGTWQDRTGRELPDDHPSSEGFALLSYDGARHCDT